jgi:hypothetical protein
VFQILKTSLEPILVKVASRRLVNMHRITICGTVYRFNVWLPAYDGIIFKAKNTNTG